MYSILPIIFAIAAAIFWGVAAVFVRLGLKRIKPQVGALISIVISVLLVGLLALILNFEELVSLTFPALLWFGLVGIVYHVIGRYASFFSIQYIGAVKSSPILGSAPLFATALAIIFIGEEVNYLVIIGTVSIIAGIYFVSTSK